ncbi:hypothetical protein EGT86_35815 [Burkholderia pseudomallei]|nr:hypothetical protein EGT86_35815 [Burkholderia pseudomallei]
MLLRGAQQARLLPLTPRDRLRHAAAPAPGGREPPERAGPRRGGTPPPHRENEAVLTSSIHTDNTEARE